jgi:eukaryotic-like serine/threonine-protein kinase
MNERDIFLTAIEIADPEQAASYVEQACGSDAGLRAQVEKLLKSHARSSQFLEVPAVAADPSATQMFSRISGIISDESAAKRASGEAEFRTYLQPATRPGSLGRLGHYEIEVILGRGAYGIVAKAFDEKLHRVVAIKLMNPVLAATSPPRQRFLREARTAAAVTHENTVAIFAVEEEPIPYLVMEYVPGQTLQQRMDTKGPLEAKEILRIGQQIAAGLAAAHGANLIHRDIKPSNILLTGGPAERAKISDFGLARAVDDASMTSSGLIAGTPMYMAPEQARGESLDHRADLFSLGSVLYQMASGRPPFRAASTVAVLKRVCEDTPRPLHDVLPGFPGWLETVIFKLLEKEPNDRYQTAQELADLLARCQREHEHDGYVTSVKGSLLAQETQVFPLPKPTDRGARRKPFGWLIGGVLAAAAVVGFALMNGEKKTPDSDTSISSIATTSPSSTEAATGTPPESTGWQGWSADAPAPAIAPFESAQAKKHQDAWANHLGVPVETTNSVGAKMILIPPGEFLMGAPDSDADASPHEKPQHRVTLTKPFAIGATEVTNRQFRQFVVATGYVTQAESDEQGAFDLHPKARQPSLIWNKLGKDETPVRCVSWEDARRFCEWMTQTEGRVYRLPTEAEWEFACRAGTATRYSFGNNFSDTPAPPGTDSTPLLPVAQLPANPFGLFDMHGSVNEMCWEAGRSFTSEPVTDPLGSLLMNGPAVVKGGAVSSRAARLRSSNRYLSDARHFPGRDFATIVKGFRVVAEIGSSPVGQSPLVSADYEWSEPVNLGASVNSGVWSDHPTVTADSLTLVFVRHPDGQPSQFWQSTRSDGAQPFGAAVRLFADAHPYDDYCPFLSHDGLTLWFHSTRPIAPNRGDQNIWVTRRRSLAEPFEKPQPLGPEINTTETEVNAFVSADGLTMLFTRGKPERFFQATRQTESDDFGNVHTLNVGFDDVWTGFPRLSADGRTLLFAAKVDEQCLWLATRDSVDAKFGVPAQLEPKLNVGEVSGPFLSADDKTLYFSSTRPGCFGRRDLWSSTRVKKGTRDVVPTNSDASSPQEIAEIGTGVFGPKIAADGLSLWFHAREDQEAQTGRLVLWQAWRQGTNEPFQKPILAEDALNNQPGHNLSDVTFSADGLVLCFCRTNTDPGSNSDLWLSTRPAGDASWSAPVSVGAGVNSDHGEWEPELSPNGLELFFHSDRPNENGGTDLWVSRRPNREAEFGPAENLGPVVNSSGNEGGAALSADGLTLLFHRIEPTGVGVWRATRKSLDAPFEAPQQLRIPMPPDDLFFSVSLSGSGEELYGLYRSKGRMLVGIARLKASAAVAAEKNFALRVSPGVHVEMPSLKLDPAAPHTLEVWVTPAITVRDNKHVLGWPPSSSLFVRIEDSSWTFGLAHADKFQFVHEAQPITPGRRVHVAIVRTGQEFRLFVDGQRVASDREHETPLMDPSRPFSLSLDSAKTAFSGDYDEVRVSRVARYDENFTPQIRFEPDADTLALYHCDENGGEQLLDSSGNEQHGKIIGRAKWIDAATSR